MVNVLLCFMLMNMFFFRNEIQDKFLILFYVLAANGALQGG